MRTSKQSDNELESRADITLTHVTLTLQGTDKVAADFKTRIPTDVELPALRSFAPGFL